MPDHSQLLIDFHHFDGTDHGGLSREDYLSFADDEMEKAHDWIQWAFPLPEPSRAQPQSPVAGSYFYSTIKVDPLARMRMTAMTARYFRFLEATQSTWVVARDHNHLRITRVIRCLHLCGMDALARNFLDYVLARARHPDGHLLIPSGTLVFWTEAITDEPSWLAPKAAS